MAEDELTVPQEVEKNIDDSIGETRKEKPSSAPIYKKYKDASIPVPKTMGKLWESRIKAGLAARKDIDSAADEAKRYYRNDQTAHRHEREGEAGNQYVTKRVNNQHGETENLVYANTNTMIPILYSKNPTVEVTAFDTEDEGMAQSAIMYERLVNVLMFKKSRPGLNFKRKAKRAVLNTQLTNSGWAYIGYTEPKQSINAALDQIRELAKELESAETADEIRTTEGKIQALEEAIDYRDPAGPLLRILRSDQVVKDPCCEEPDGSDADWIGHWDYMPTAFIKAKFLEETDGKLSLVVKPTHVLKLDAKTDEKEGDNFSLFTKDSNAKKHGYDDENAYVKAQYTKVWWIWDRVTKRVMLYVDKDFTWPVWVMDDPYELDKFDPYYRLYFVEDPDGGEAKGEVVYYLDQQDAINEINSEIRRGRQWAKGNLFFNSNVISQKDFEAAIKGPDGTGRGVKVPSGTTLKDHIFALVPPALSNPELFDKSDKYQAIDRVSSTNEVVRGGQFRTNTTNRAIEQYTDAASIRLEEKTDAIEDWIGDIGYGLMQLCCQFMTKEEVASHIGDKMAEGWTNMDATEFRKLYSFAVVGGSTRKPTTQAKRQEALQMSQTIGQFASASPYAIVFALKLMENAFDDFTISNDEWDKLLETIERQLERGNSEAGAGGGNDAMEQAVQLAVSRGVPEEQARQAIANQTQ